MNSVTIARNSLWSGLDAAAGIILGVVGSILVARAMGPEKLGHYNYVLWLTGLTGALATFGIPAATRKFGAELLGQGRRDAAAGLFHFTLRLQTVISVIVVALGLLWVFLRTRPEYLDYTAIAVLSILPLMVMSVVTQANLASEDFRSNVIPSLLSILLTFAGTVLVLWRGWDLVGLMTVLLLGRVGDLGLRHAYFRKNFPAPPPTPSPGLWRRYLDVIPPETRHLMRRFCTQSSVLFLLNTVVWNRTELFFLERYSPVAEITYFSLGFNFLEKVALIPQVFASAVGVTLMVQYGRDRSSVGDLAVQAARYLALISLPLCLGLAALSAPFVLSLYGQPFAPAILPLTVQAVLSIPRMLLLPAQQLLIAGDKQGFLWKWTLVCAVLNVGLDMWWIPMGGAVGASAANGLTQFVAAIGIWWFARQCFVLRLPWLSLGRLLAASLVMAALVAPLGFLRPGWITLLGCTLIGAILFLLLLRLFRVLDQQDRSRLMSLHGQIPASMRGYYARLVGLLLPPAGSAG